MYSNIRHKHLQYQEHYNATIRIYTMKYANYEK